MVEIKLDRKQHEHLANIEKWCQQRIGPGSRRFVKNSWMGMDDWYYYEDRAEREWTEEQIENGDNLHIDDCDDEDSDLIFVFRRESDATVFSLKWQ